MTIRSRLLILLIPPLTAFLVLNSLFFYLDWSREFMLAASFITLLLVIGTVFAIADRISQPVRQLNKAALEIAAGDYEANIHVEGPKEIEELAHTFNTMSHCLVEHMSRLKESSLIRERMYGEYECSLLLQHYMLQKVIEDYSNPHLTIRLISLPQTPVQKGLLLRVEKTPTCNQMLTLFESYEQGFSGLFQLNQLGALSRSELQNTAYIECQFIDQYHRFRYHAHTLFAPLVWSVNHRRFINDIKGETELEDLDMVFLFNSSVIHHFETEEAIKEWFARVLRHFSEDGLDSIQVMLTNELSFLAKKQHIKHNFKIIGLQVKRLSQNESL